jgi:hypothetical protein
MNGLEGQVLAFQLKGITKRDLLDIHRMKNSICALFNGTEFIDFYLQFHRQAS